MRKIRRIILAVVVVLLAVAAWVWYLQCGGVSHREIKEAVEEESAEIQRRIDDRCTKLEQKLERIEGKLDLLLELARPKLPDGMKVVE